MTAGRLGQCAWNLLFEGLLPDQFAQLGRVLMPMCGYRMHDCGVEIMLVASCGRQIAVVLTRHLTAVDRVLLRRNTEPP
jgi:hypothetical protein